jgi:hypothetical protein
MTSRTIVVLGLCALASSAQAAEVSGTFSALMSGFEQPRSSCQSTSTPCELSADTSKDYPLYGLASLQVDELALPGFEQSRLVLMGWGRLQLASGPASGDPDVLSKAAFDRNANAADLSLLYLDGRSGSLHLRLGRQHLTEGGGRMEMIDGLEADYATRLGIGVSAFAGFLTREQFKSPSGDFGAGGRVSYRLGLPGELGVSYVQKWQDSEVSSQQLGVDGFYDFDKIRLLGYGVYAPVEKRLAEARLAATLPLDKHLFLTIDGMRVAPDLLIPRTSIFSVFADAPHDSFGGDVQWDASPYYTFGLEAHGLRQDDASLGYRASVRAVAYREPSHNNQLGVELRRVDEKFNAYSRLRAYTALQLISAFKLAVDAYAYRYDEEINATKASYVGQVSGIYDFTRSIRLAATVSAGATPYAKSQVEGWLRLAYGYQTDFAREWTP